MAAPRKQRFTIYLLTLLFIWVNGVAAPYHSIQSWPTDEASAQNLNHLGCDYDYADAGVSLQLQYAPPINHTVKSIHTAYPAEETFEEQEESQRKDEDGCVYQSLPKHLSLTKLADIYHPRYLSHHTLDLHDAVLKQSTYLLDCTFLI